MENYKRTIIVSNNAASAYQSLTVGIEHWWTRPDNPISQLGDRAKFTFPPGQSFWTFEATALKPNSYVELECVDALHLHEGQPKAIEQEWLGTKLVWHLREIDNKTHIQLEHLGLVPSLHCYDICQAGWDFFFMGSLKSYLDTGVGKPHR